MIILLLWIVVALATVGTTVFFKSFIAYRIPNDVLRIITIGLFSLASCFGFVAGCTWLAVGAMYPTTTRGINDTYSFTQQPYGGFATSDSYGYDLVFFQNRDFWLDKEIGKVRLDCGGNEDVAAEIKPGLNNHNRLIIKLNNVAAVDTVLSFDENFDLKHRAYNYQ